MGPPSPLKFEMRPSPERQNSQSNPSQMQQQDFSNAGEARREGWANTELSHEARKGNDLNAPSQHQQPSESHREILVMEENSRLKNVISKNTARNGVHERFVESKG